MGTGPSSCHRPPRPGTEWGPQPPALGRDLGMGSTGKTPLACSTAGKGREKLGWFWVFLVELIIHLRRCVAREALQQEKGLGFFFPIVFFMFFVAFSGFQRGAEATA